MNEEQFNPLSTIAEILNIVAHTFFPPAAQSPGRLPALGELPANMVLPAGNPVPPPVNPAPPVVKNPEQRVAQEIIPLLYE